MKTKSKNPINFMRRWGIMLGIVLIVAIATFSQWGGNPVGTAVNNQFNPMMITNDISSEVAPNDEQTAKNYVLNVEQLVNLFEKSFQSARISSIDTRMGHLTKMNSVYEKFSGLEYSQDNPMVQELKQLAGLWMDKRMNYIGNKLVMELVYENNYRERAYSTKAVLALLEEGNGTYIMLLDQMNKVKGYYSM